MRAFFALRCRFDYDIHGGGVGGCVIRFRLHKYLHIAVSNVLSGFANRKLSLVTFDVLNLGSEMANA